MVVSFERSTPNTQAYLNLTKLFEECNNVDSCNLYLQAAEELRDRGEIKQIELYSLRRIGRTKRIELAHPAKKEAQKAEKPGLYLYTPEMGDQMPDCQIYASQGYYGKHEYLYTDLELKGRGIEHLGESNANSGKLRGRYRYRVTVKAFEKLKELYSIGKECLLD